MVTEFFVKPLGLPYHEAISMYSAVNVLSYVLMPILPFYKALSDKFGRKPFLVFNIIGMGVGMTLSAWAPNPIIYFIGYGLVKGTGALSVALLPVIRSVVMGDDSTMWRGVYGISAVLAFAIAVFAMLGVRETNPFLKQRVEYLEMPYDQRHPAKQKREKNAAKGTDKSRKTGVVVAMKHLFKSKQLFWLTVVGFSFGISSMTLSSYVESIMSNFGMSTEEITTALFIQPFFNTGLTWIAGFISDRIGRKRIIAIAGTIAITGFVCFNLSAFMGASPYIVGVCYGIYLGCWWIVMDYQGMMIAESAPTYNRTSVMGAVSLLTLIGTAIGVVMPIGSALIFDKIGFGYMLIAAPFVIIGIVLMLWKVKETKGVDLNEVEYEDEKQE